MIYSFLKNVLSVVISGITFVNDVFLKSQKHGKPVVSVVTIPLPAKHTLHVLGKHLWTDTFRSGNMAG